MIAYEPWRVLHVRLDEIDRELELGAHHAGVHVVFWWQDLPLGAIRIASQDLPVSTRRAATLGLDAIAPTLAANVRKRLGRATATGRHSAAGGCSDVASTVAKIERPLARIYGVLEESRAEASTLGASVVVCTRDRPQSLGRCLDSLSTTLTREDEILVVDNAGRTAETRRRIERYPGIRYVKERQPGLDIARNAGIRACAREIVAFCDDDVRVEPNWLGRMKAAFLDPTVAAVTGLVLPASLETEAEYLFETCWGFNRGFEPRDFGPEYFARNRSRGAPVWEIGAGASMAFRRSVFARVGGFDERLGAGAAGCSGDSEMWYRILAAGHTCRYEPAAVAYHDHRRTIGELESQIYSYMRGHATALLVQLERHGDIGNLRRLLVTLPVYFASRSMRRLVGIDDRRTRTLSQETAGWLAGIAYYLKRRRQAPPRVVENDAAESPPSFPSGDS